MSLDLNIEAKIKELEEDTEQLEINQLIYDLTCIRKRKRISQKDLARTIAVTPMTVSRIENYAVYNVGGRCNPTIKLILAYARAVGYELQLVPVSDDE